MRIPCWGDVNCSNSLLRVGWTPIFRSARSGVPNSCLSERRVGYRSELPAVREAWKQLEGLRMRESESECAPVQSISRDTLAFSVWLHAQAICWTAFVRFTGDWENRF
jgi:hypothetical protein